MEKNIITMKSETDITNNWLFEDKMTEISSNNDNEKKIIDNVKNEIECLVKDINSKDSISFKRVRKEIELQSLPLYFPQGITAKRISSSRSYTKNTQRWIGHIIKINNGKFKAKLEDITTPGTFEIGTFDIQDMFEEKDMIQIGAVFYLSVGYEVSKGTSVRQKLIRFQRLSEWSETDFNKAIDRADRIAANLEWE